MGNQAGQTSGAVLSRAVDGVLAKTSRLGMSRKAAPSLPPGTNGLTATLVPSWSTWLDALTVSRIHIFYGLCCLLHADTPV